MPGCHLQDNGTLTANATGGTAPYFYNWSNGNAGQTLTAGAGNYTVTVTDNTGQVLIAGSTIQAAQEFVVGNITASQVICYNTIPEGLTGTAPAGGIPPYNYQWQVSTDNVAFTNIPGVTTLNYTPPSWTSGRYYRQVQNSANNCGSLTTNVVSIKVYPRFAVGSAAASQAISYNTVPAALTGTTPTGGRPPYSYQWQNSQDSVTFADIPGATSAIYQPGALTETAWYRQIQSSANDCSDPLSVTNVVMIKVYPIMIAGTIAADQVIPQHTAPAELTGTAPSGGNPPYTYQWESSEDNIAYSGISGATSINYQPGELAATTYFRQVQISTGGFGVTTNVVTIAMTLLPPPSLDLTNITIAGSQTQCYDATQTITIAGGGTAFLVQPGGSVNLIAGQNIFMLTGTRVEPGGYLHGHITTTGQYCSNPNIPVPAAPFEVIETTTGISGISSDITFGCYPNPTTGRFNLWLSAEPGEKPVFVRLYNMLGVEILIKTIYSGKLHEFSLENQPAGIYLVKVVQNGKAWIIKVMRQ